MKRRVSALLWSSFMTIMLSSFLLLGEGCSTARFKEKADAEVYSILQEKNEMVPNAESDFSIDPPETPFPLDELPRVESDTRELGLSVPDQTGSSIINLEQSILLAVQQNRSYQNAKEALFLQILALTLERHRYAPIFSDQGGLSLKGDAIEESIASEFPGAMARTGSIIGKIENQTGAQADLLRA